MKPIALFLLGILAAGCAQPGTAPDTNDTATIAQPEPTETPGVETNPAETQSTTYTIRQDNLTYDHQLLRWSVVADGNVTVNVDGLVSVPAGTFDQDCRVVRGTQSVGGNRTLFYGVVIPIDAQVEGRAQVAGTNVTLLPPQFPSDSPGSGQVTIAIGAAGRLSAGQSMTFETGGSRPWYGAGDYLQISVDGPSHIVSLPAVPIVCGYGSRGASGATAGASTYLTDASFGGHIAFHSDNGMTFVGLGGVQNSSVHVRMSGKDTAVTGDTRLVHAGPGEGRLVFDQWTGFPDQLAWLFVAEAWPDL